MRRALPVGLYLLLYPLLSVASAEPQEQVIIMEGAQLLSGFDMGINSSEGKTGWVSSHDGYMEMAYPSGQSWGAVFVTVGKPREPPRPKRDFSGLSTLLIDMKGREGGEEIGIGIKTNTQPNDGTETKIPVKMSSDWKTYEFPLSRFVGTDLQRLYVVAEFVFGGSKATTVYLKNIRYSSSTPKGRGSSREVREASIKYKLAAEAKPSADPAVTITQPATDRELKIWSGTKPSLLVKGRVNGIPNGYRIYLGVHPTHSNSVWTHEVHSYDGQWLAQAYFGDDRSTPRDGESFELVALISETPLPDRFSELPDVAYYTSDIVRVNISVQSWMDRAGAFMRDVGVSVPISAFFTSAGGIVGILLGQRASRKKEASLRGKTSKPHEAPSRREVGP